MVYRKAILSPWFLSLATIGLFIASLAGFFGLDYWISDLLSHFRPHLLAFSVIVLVLTFMGRRLDLAAIMAVLIGVNLLALMPNWQIPRADAAPEGVRTVKIVNLNLWRTNPKPQKVLDFLATEQPDIAILQEGSPEWKARLETLSKDFPYQAAMPREDAFFPYSMLILSKHRLANIEAVEIADSYGAPIVAAVATIGGQKLRILNVHTTSPVTLAHFKARQRQFRDIAAWAAAHEDLPLLIAGDFNATAFSPIFHEFLATTHLRSTLPSFISFATWPSFLPIRGLTIDHQFANDGILLKSARRGPYVGSDHYPVITEIAIKPR